MAAEADPLGLRQETSTNSHKHSESRAATPITPINASPQRLWNRVQCTRNERATLEGTRIPRGHRGLQRWRSAILPWSASQQTRTLG